MLILFITFFCWFW